MTSEAPNILAKTTSRTSPRILDDRVIPLTMADFFRSVRDPVAGTSVSKSVGFGESELMRPGSLANKTI
jgi:hypothetical protein